MLLALLVASISDISIYPENAEVHILEDEDASRAYLLQVWAEAMTFYRSGHYSMKFSKSIQRQLVEVQKDFMPEDTEAGQFVAGNVPFPAPLPAISGEHPGIGEWFPAGTAEGVDRIKLAVCCRDGCHLVAGFVAGDSPVWIRKKPVNKVFSNIYLYLRQRKQRDFSRKLIK